MSPNKWPEWITLLNGPEQSSAARWKNLDVWFKWYNGLMNYVHGRAVTSLSHSAPRRKHTHTTNPWKTLEWNRFPLPSSERLWSLAARCYLWGNTSACARICLPDTSEAAVRLISCSPKGNSAPDVTSAWPLDIVLFIYPCARVCLCEKGRESTLQMRWFHILRTCFKLKRSVLWRATTPSGTFWALSAG